jgi:DMSO/TMAO reductase YedYZ heme-binding membrane subunit
MIALATTTPSPLWYLTRGTGATTLILLTVSVVLGVANVRRIRAAGLPRFVFDELHRNVSLLAIAFLLVHIVTTLFDPFAPINLIDAVIPFTSAYRPLWLGFGAIASDLLIAVTVTSVLRRRLGYPAWRAVHFLAYACWPVALLHGLGTGSDAKATWMIALTAACLVAVLVAAAARVSAGWPNHRAIRISAMSAAAMMPIGLLVWLPSGPLAQGWASRAGTPSSLLAAGAGGAAAPSSSSHSPPHGTPPSSAQPNPFNAAVSGGIRQGLISQGRYAVRLSLTVAGQHLSALRIRIFGRPLGGGGVSMTASSVTLGTTSDPSLYKGEVTALNGANVEARVQSAGGTTLTILAQLRIDPSGGNVAGTVNVQPA